MGGRRGSSSADSVHRQSFRFGSLRTHYRQSQTNLSAFETCNTTLFANPVTGRPYHQESLQKSQIKRAAKLAGLGEDIGWHTFRHSYRSWLDETGAPMKVQQELMRHASIQTTMNVYGRAMTETKRHANSQVVGLVFGPNSQELPADAATATVQ